MNKEKSSKSNNSDEEIIDEDEHIRNLFKQLGFPDFKLAQNSLNITQELEKSFVVCKICEEFKTCNPDEICDDCKVSIISSDDIPPNM